MGSKRRCLSLSVFLDRCVLVIEFVFGDIALYGNRVDGWVDMWENFRQDNRQSEMASSCRSWSLCIDEEITSTGVREKTCPEARCVPGGRFDRDTYWTVEKTNACLIRNRFSLYNVIFHASRVRDKAVVYYKPSTLCHLSHVDSIKLLKNGNRCLVNISRRMSPYSAWALQDFPLKFLF